MPARIAPPRWYLKKAARRGMVFAAWASGGLAVRERASARPCVRVLTYHRLGNAKHDPFCVSPSVFQAQMRYLADHGLAVRLADVEAFLADEKDLRSGSVLVTVDDAFRSVHTEMLPVLSEYAIPAVAYVSPGLIGDGESPRADGTSCHAPEPYLTWDELGGLAQSGVVIGSHAWTHRSLGRLSPAEVRDEASRSREVLQARLGCPATSFAYPYGTRADFNRATASILAEVGYTTAFTSRHGAIAKGAEPLELPRIKVEGGEGLWMFRRLCRGALDGWRLADRALWRWQHSGR